MEKHKTELIKAKDLKIGDRYVPSKLEFKPERVYEVIINDWFGKIQVRFSVIDKYGDPHVIDAGGSEKIRVVSPRKTRH